MSTSSTGSTPHPLAAASPQQAVDALLARLTPLGSEQVAWADAVGRVVAADLLADRPSPASSVSAMDGYALCLADASISPLPVSGFVLPGEPAPRIPPGHALRIMTGAVVPDEAELVVRREDVTEESHQVRINPDVKLTMGQNIRRRGENLPAGGIAVHGGTLVTPAVMACLTSFGHARLSVRKKVRVRVIVTGDELLDADATPQPWQIRDSNGPTLRALLSVCPWIELRGVVRAVDQFQALATAIGAALSDCDALLLTGGVSMGTHDFVPDALRHNGCDVVFHRVPLRPGGPLLGAAGPAGQAVMGLPGNPVSVMVTARRLAMPALAHLAGLATRRPAPVVRLVNDDGKMLKLWWYRPVRLAGDGAAEIVETRGSGDVVSAAASDGFIEVPPGATGEGPWPFYAWSF